ncbi:MAG: 3-hydroxyacyl-CoA dehydrogenase NAD-binding domain-containing protein [Phycisphaerales bacterium]|nr:3-hydroxyacyl-CoA dehydrogenase NAD-binding domain-containing protein [Phycisphaerales bacterium]
MDTMQKHVTIQKADGIATITFNVANSPVNVLNDDSIKDFALAVADVAKDQTLKGVVVASAKSDFLSGGDLKSMMRPGLTKEVFWGTVMQLTQAIRQLETCGKPVVALINGNALGGGCEMALGCHYRIMLQRADSRIGLVECSIGLMPGAGGTQRFLRLFGPQKAVEYITLSKKFTADEALKDGLVHQIVNTPEELVQVAKKWILDNPQAIQPWDKKGYRVPGAPIGKLGANDPFFFLNAHARKNSHGNYPNITNVLEAIYNGVALPIEKALELEAKYFMNTLFSKEAANIIRSTFLNVGEAQKGVAKPAAFLKQKSETKKLGILGAGMMGAGVAYVAAKVGIPTVLKDVTKEAAQKGKDYSVKIEESKIAKKKTTREKADAILSKITPSDSVQDLAGCDLIIEAVFESEKLKNQVTKETESVIAADAFFGSNTSTIPISDLAKGSVRPKNFIGIHFFSPVDKMPLVEIIVGKETGDAAIAKAIDFVTQIKKVPIVVNDGRGFFTSRVFGQYVYEGVALLQDGVHPAVIENVAKKAGMPVGPLAVTDEVNLKLVLHTASEKKDLTEFEKKIIATIDKMANQLNRPGKKEGAGFYEYPTTGKKYLWPELNKHFACKIDQLSHEVIQQRLLHTMALDTYRCLDTKVLRTPQDGDLGSILGLGFPPYTGGAISYIDYIGVDRFVEQCDALAKQFGDRFAVPDSLRARAKDKKKFY